MSNVGKLYALQNQVATLTTQVTTLATENTNLNQLMDTYGTDYSQITNSYSQLNTSYYQLNASYSQLNTSYYQLNDTHTYLQNKADWLDQASRDDADSIQLLLGFSFATPAPGFFQKIEIWCSDHEESDRPDPNDPNAQPPWSQDVNDASYQCGILFCCKSSYTWQELGWDNPDCGSISC